MLAIEDTDEACDALLRSFWTRARAKTLSTSPAGAPRTTTGATGSAGGARVIDLLSWTGAQRALRPTPR
ncbi:MAG: hypothetical protein ACRENE_20660 [Polyangiaceae bacterium]